MLNTNSKHHTCNSCRKKFTVDFKKNELQKKLPCPYCGVYQIIKPKTK